MQLLLGLSQDELNVHSISDLEGDIYIDNAINIYDLIQLSELITENQFLDKGDVNGDGEINNEDIFYIINLIF